MSPAHSAGFSRERVFGSKLARCAAERQLRAVGFTFFVGFYDPGGYGLRYGHAPAGWPDPCPEGQRWSQPGHWSQPGKLPMVEAFRRAGGA